ncbi:MFS transporter [Nonomuraea insulae]|uniref:MFS transporter n=1 Tax=Nonomuraea insulae TaxID=1616787 RepID=A0ABW1CK18_9ACTN
MTKHGLLQPLRHRRFRLLLTGQAVSAVGDWLDLLGLVVLVLYVWNLGPGAMAAVVVVSALPWLLAAPVAGVLADRLPARAVLIGCDLGRAAVVLGYLLAPDLGVLLVLIAAKNTLSALFAPAEQAAVKRVVPEEDLLRAITVTTFVNQAAKIAGPVLGGVLVGAYGPQVVFVCDAATFAVSALVLTRLPGIRPAGGQRPERTSFLTELTAGFTHIRRSALLMAAIGAMTATTFLIFVYDVLSPLALKELGAAPGLLGVVMAGVGAGTVVGALLVGRVGDAVRPLTLMGLGQAGIGLAVSSLGLLLLAGARPWPALLVAVGALTGLSSAGFMIAFPYVLQTATPEELVGRVSATANAGPTVVQLAAPPLGALLAVHLGVGAVFTAAGTALALLGLGLMALRAPASPPALTEPGAVAHAGDPPE